MPMATSAGSRVGGRMRPGAVAVAWHDSAEVARARMDAAGVDAVPVVAGDGGRVVGLVERAAAEACRRGGNWLGAVPVASLMRRGAFCCRADDAPAAALEAMDRLGADLLAVLDRGGRVVGLLARDRLEAALAAATAAAGVGQRSAAGL
jgi:CBS domain-containing protein